MDKPSSNIRNLSQPIVAALWEGKKINAIKLLREEQNLGLKEAKDLIDQHIQHNPALQKQFSLFHSEDIRGVGFVLLVILMLVLAFYFFFL
ncbi:ribosomal protein L7/L12 [Candidatus Nitrospira salsa]|nr:MAG: hypothetical protein NPIRA01_24550 [Nitrospirales bacterium]